LNGKQARAARRIAADVRKRHRTDVEKIIAAWPWWRRAISWLSPKTGERWADEEIRRAEDIDDFAERRTYRWLKSAVKKK
jgi:hypothetical protein